MRSSASSSSSWSPLLVATACTLTSALVLLAVAKKTKQQQRPQQQSALSRNMGDESKRVVYLNNADACLDYVVGADDRDEFEDVKVAALAICPQWEGVDPETITVKIVSGGITNRLFRLTHGDVSVLVRLYGDNTEAFIDRNVENMLFALLSKQGFAPTYHGRFINGRIEGWMDARPLEPEEMGLGKFLDLVGKELGRMHLIEAPLDHSKPVLWSKIDQFEHLASEITFPDDSAKAAALANLDLPRVRADLAWLKTVLPSAVNGNGQELLAGLGADVDEITKQAFGFANDIVFCHNDALSGNILYNDAWDRVQIIDYEYGGYNFRGFDFANHFCEHCGFEMDLRLYPDAEQQVQFFRGYMAMAAPELLASLDANKESKAFFHALYPLVNRYALASHLFWGFWAVVQAAHSKIDFDFLDYANKRFTTFRYHRAFFFEMPVEKE